MEQNVIDVWYVSETGTGTKGKRKVHIFKAVTCYRFHIKPNFIILFFIQVSSEARLITQEPL